jgi:hypothetical protein
MLLQIARGEVRRRGPRWQLTGPELDDLAYQAAAGALIAITGKLGQFRGESRFTTWAYKFVICEVSAKIGRHFWRHPSVPLDTDDWDRLPGRFGFDPAREAEWRDLLAALRDEAPDRRHCRPPGSPDRITLLVPRWTDGHADMCAGAGPGRPYARSAGSGRFICVPGPG